MDGWMSATTGQIAIKYMTYSCPSQADSYFLWKIPSGFSRTLAYDKILVKNNECPSASAEFSTL